MTSALLLHTLLSVYPPQEECIIVQTPARPGIPAGYSEICFHPREPETFSPPLISPEVPLLPPHFRLPADFNTEMGASLWHVATRLGDEEADG